MSLLYYLILILIIFRPMGVGQKRLNFYSIKIIQFLNNKTQEDSNS